MKTCYFELMYQLLHNTCGTGCTGGYACSPVCSSCTVLLQQCILYERTYIDKQLAFILKNGPGSGSSPPQHGLGGSRLRFTVINSHLGVTRLKATNMQEFFIIIIFTFTGSVRKVCNGVYMYIYIYIYI